MFMHKKNSLKNVRYIILASTLIIAAMSGFSVAHAEQGSYVEAASAGNYTFQRFCSVCHGKDAKGDGLFAPNLDIPTPDLTLLTAANGNVFPWKRIYLSIDGSDKPIAHGTSQMPIWGEMFDMRNWNNEEVNAEVIVRGRIFELLLYLDSIQEPMN